MIECKEHNWDTQGEAQQLHEAETKNFSKAAYSTYFQSKNDVPCYEISQKEAGYFLKVNYFVGVDWIEPQQQALCVKPKLNDGLIETDYLQMLFACLQHPEISRKVQDLYIIKWDQPSIQVKQQQDLLTPLLIIEFLNLLKVIVQKGLKNAYSPVTKNLQSKLKGKVLVEETVKQQAFKHQFTQVRCKYDEFGIDNKENRLLKKALQFAQKHLSIYPQLTHDQSFQRLFSYIKPAFSAVRSNINTEEIKGYKINRLYKEYRPALHLAKLILKRFGYNIAQTAQRQISTPPFWIDMSKLFELYVLGLLKDRFQNQVSYHLSTYGNELDYILNSSDYQIVIDAKYKPSYQQHLKHSDIRQVSGYARLTKVYQHLQKAPTTPIDCLIIYPDQENGYESLANISLLETEIPAYQGVYKLGVKLPVV